MSNMLKSFGIVLGLSILLFLILKLAGLPNADNAKLALTPFTIIAFVYSKLEEIDKAKHSDDKLQSLNDFSLPSWKAYLLGTITGLIGAFAAVAKAAAADRSTILSAKISEAMNNTWLGLAIAVTCMIGHVFLNAASKKQQHELEAFSMKLENLLTETMHSAGQR